MGGGGVTGRSRRSLMLFAAVCCMAMTACGTTVPLSSSRGAAPIDAQGSLGSSAEQPGGIGSAPAGTPSAADPAPLAGGRAATERAQPDALAGNAGSGVDSRPTVSGVATTETPGVTASKIYIGLAHDHSQDPAIGLGAAIPRPPVEQIQSALIHWFNAHGGLAKRKVEPVYHTYSTTSGTYAQTQQEACDHFTKDRRVFAALSAGTYGLQTDDSTYQSCMAKRGALAISGAGTRGDDVAYRSLPSMIDASGLNYTRLAKVYVDLLVANGFLTSKSKIGLLYVERPDTERAITRMLEPRLAAHGLRLFDKRGFRQHQSDGDAGAAVSDMSAAVLRFQSDGVDRVLFLEATGGAIPLLFMRQAESQNYYPRYALTSTQAAQGLQSTYPAASQHGAVGVGWVPLLDVSPVGRTPRTAAANRCDAIIAAEGLARPQDEIEEVQRLEICEPFFFLEASLDKVIAARAPVTAAAFLRATASLGESFDSAMTWYGTRFGQRPHDGAAAVRYLRYIDSCTCYRSSGPVVSAS